MTATTLFYILIAILIINFLFETILSYLNAKHFNDKVPEVLNDIYNKEEYLKSQAYKEENERFSTLFSVVLLSITLIFFFFKGFPEQKNRL